MAFVEHEPEPNLNVPSASRVYDYLLDGAANAHSDREFARRLQQVWPDARTAFAANRRFANRATRYCAQQGIDQFLDIGAGMPGTDATHVLARRYVPDARVVYVDNEPVASAWEKNLVDSVDGTAAVRGDLQTPLDILRNPVVTGMLDFDRPVAVLLSAVLHFLPDEVDPHGIVATIRDYLLPGSVVVISHATPDADPAAIAAAAALYRERNQNPGIPRTRDEVARFFDGMELVEPGLVWLPEWRPDGLGSDVSDGRRTHAWCGVGRVIEPPQSAVKSHADATLRALIAQVPSSGVDDRDSSRWRF